MRLRALPLLALALLTACGRQDGLSPITESSVGQVPPVAEKREFEVTAPHGAARADEYYWLRDDSREDAGMLAYLEAENRYTDTALAPLKGLAETLYGELVGRLKQDDASVPYRYRGYWYYTRYEEGREYPIHARRRGSMEAAEEILLDVNQLAEGHDFYQLGNWQVSPDNRRLAFLEDTVGRRQFQLAILDLKTGEIARPGIGGLSSSLVWGGDSESLYYVENDPSTLLTKRVFRHRIGGDSEELYREPDDSFYMGVGLTRSEQYVCIYVQSTVSNEQRCTSREEPGEFRLIAARERDFEYSADHLNGRWVVRTNWNAQNFKLMQFEDGAWDEREAWRDLVAHDSEVFITGSQLFDDFIAVGERSGGLTRIRILHANGDEEYVRADEAAYAMSLGRNAEPQGEWLRYNYTSLTTPGTTYEINVKNAERKLLKEEPVLGGFERDNYATDRLWAEAGDGARIPITLLYRKGFKPDGSAPLLQYGYGSYGASMEPYFNRNLLSLVDRGMVYAIAHIRGGQEMGRHWYESGKLRHKRNTFSDFIDVTDFLVKEGYAAPDRVAAYGGSAGGLLMGAVSNMAPDKYRAIVSLVPFVDVVTTMLDHSIPLTTNEFDEWGNPENAGDYEYMLSYSPYDNIAEAAYPAMFVGTGLWDSQVQYWEPAKYVARLRARKTDGNLVVFRTQMEAGHGGRSGRFQRYHEIAEWYAFVLNQLQVH